MIFSQRRCSGRLSFASFTLVTKKRTGRLLSAGKGFLSLRKERFLDMKIEYTLEQKRKL